MSDPVTDEVKDAVMELVKVLGAAHRNWVLTCGKSNLARALGTHITLRAMAKNLGIPEGYFTKESLNSINEAADAIELAVGEASSYEVPVVRA